MGSGVGNTKPPHFLKMSQLVTYGAPAAMNIYRKRKRIRYAQTAANYIYANRKEIGKGLGRSARVIQRAWKRRRSKRTRRSRMQSSAEGGGKASESIKNAVARSVFLRVIDGEWLPNARAPIQPNDFNVRDKANVYYSGYKICRVFENRGPEYQDIYTVNYAIIQYNRGIKSGTLPDPENFDTIKPILKENFFRQNLEVSTRTADFQDAPIAGTALWDMTYDCRPMNPNKNYKIIMRKKFTLYPRAAGGGERGQRLNQNFKRLEFWLPIKKKMGFQDRAAELCNTPFAEIWWTNTRSPDDWPTTTPGLNEDVQTYAHHKLYFRG